AIGAEAFIPPTSTESLGVFYIHELDLDPLKFSAGVRLQRDEVALADGLTMDGVSERDFSLVTVSAGAVRELGGDWQATINWQRSERAPTQEELVANGPHIATQAFEIGDPALDKEISNNIDFGIHGRLGPLHLRADAFYNNIDDFVFLANTPDVEDDLPVQVWSQSDASFWGVELEASYLVDLGPAGDVEWRVFADSVEAEVDAGNGEIPRLSPARAGAGLDWHRGNWRANVSYYRVFDKEDVAEFETETDGYDMLTANAVYTVPLDRADVELFIKGSNLLDQTQRVHTSFLKNQAPLPGVNVTGGVRVHF
ncbi:MAG: TonB-dependent receptor, partial [Candidatus Wenzhouxiangella sp. M2_3B_020]